MEKMHEFDWIKEVTSLNINVTQKEQELLEKYYEILVEYNEHTNITAITKKEDVYLKHFYDSLTLTKIANLESGKLLDIGSGAGFPGMVLAIFFPNLQITLLDSNNKKIAFLTYAKEILKLNNIEVVYNRAEDYVRNHKEQFDFVTSRAVAHLRIILELGIPALKIGGYFLGMKGNIETELEESKETIEVLNSQIDKVVTCKLPKEGAIRNLLCIKKIDKSLLDLPRPYEKILKKPLKKKKK